MSAVAISVYLEAPVHMGLSKVGVGCLLSWQVLHALFELSIVSLESDHVLRQDLLVKYEAREWLLLMVRGLSGEDGLCISEGARIAVKDVALVLASCSVHVHLDDLVKVLIWQSRLER